MSRLKLLLISFIIFTVIITLLGPVLAEDIGPFTVNIHVPLTKVSPGDTVNLMCMVVNNGDKAAEIYPEMSLPPDWKLLMPVNKLSISPGMSETVVIPVFVGENSRAGSYSIPISFTTAKSNKIISKECVITVKEVNRLFINCLKSPDYVIAGENYRAVFTVCNQGNTKQEIQLRADENLGFPVKVNPGLVQLEPGDSIKVTAEVTVPVDYNKSTGHSLRLTATGQQEGKILGTAAIRVKIIPRKISTTSIYYTYPLKLTFGAKNNSDKIIWQLKGKGKLKENSKQKLSFNLNNKRNYIRYSSPAFKLEAGDSSIYLSPLLRVYNKNYIKLKKENEKMVFNLLYFDDNSWGVKTARRLNENNNLAVQYLNLSAASDLLTVKDSFKYNSNCNFDIEYGRHLGSDMPAALYISGDYYGNKVNSHLLYKREDKDFLNREEKHKYLRLYTTFPFSKNGHAGVNFLQNKESKKVGCKLSWQKEKNCRGLRFASSLLTDSEYSYNIFSRKSLTSGINLSQKLGLNSSKNDNKISKEAFYKLYLYRSLVNGTFSSYINLKYPLQAEDNRQIGGGLYYYRRLNNNNTFTTGFHCYNLLSHNYRLYLQGKHKNDNGNMLTYRGEVNLSDTGKTEIKTELAYTIPLQIPLHHRSNLSQVTGHIKDSNGQGVKNTIVKVNGKTTVTDKNGYYIFPAVPIGNHYLAVNKPPKYDNDYLFLPVDLLGINVKADKIVEKNFTLVKGVDIKGKIILEGNHPQDNPKKSSIYGVPQINKAQIYQGIIIELIHKGKAYRKISSENGKFNFNNLPPGKWELIVHKNGLSDLYNINPAKEYILLEEGEKREIKIKITPVKRTIQLQEGETVKYSD